LTVRGGVNNRKGTLNPSHTAMLSAVDKAALKQRLTPLQYKVAVEGGTGPGALCLIGRGCGGGGAEIGAPAHTSPPLPSQVKP